MLEEYFVPVDRFDEFIPRLQATLRQHEVNVINISIRHARQDPGSLLAWARTEVFAFVIYYKQGTSDAAREQVGVWTREANRCFAGRRRVVLPSLSAAGDPGAIPARVPAGAGICCLEAAPRSDEQVPQRAL